MKAIAVLREGEVAVVDLPLPTYGDYECLVRTHACGFCSSTDMKIIQNHLADVTVQYPTILGHEGAGEIVAVGKKVKNFHVGDRVTCSRGMYVQGTDYTFTWGEMSQYAVAHDVKAMVEAGIDLSKATPGKTLTTYPVRLIPDGMSYEDAVMILTFEENYSALLNFGLQPGMDLLVWGDGTIAKGLSYFAKLLGAGSVCCAGHHDEKLREIQDYAGVDLTINTKRENMEEALGGRQFDMVIDAVGSMAVIKEAFKYLKNNGKVCVYGVLSKDAANLNLFDMKNNTSLQLLTWPEDEHRVHDIIVDLIREGKLVPSESYSHVMPYTEIKKVVEMIRNREATKIILNMD